MLYVQYFISSSFVSSSLLVLIGLRKLNACRLALRKLPSDSVGVIGRLWRAKVSIKNIYFIRTLCFSAFHDLHEIKY